MHHICIHSCKGQIFIKKENAGTPRRSIVQIRRASQRKRELPLPMPFELPTNFNVSIQECLDNKHLTGKARGKFITAIAHSIFKHKSYPTQEEYKHVAEMMVQKWKFLQTKAGCVSSSCALYKVFTSISLAWSKLWQGKNFLTNPQCHFISHRAT